MTACDMEFAPPMGLRFADPRAVKRDSPMPDLRLIADNALSTWSIPTHQRQGEEQADGQRHDLSPSSVADMRGRLLESIRVQDDSDPRGMKLTIFGHLTAGGHLVWRRHGCTHSRYKRALRLNGCH